MNTTTKKRSVSAMADLIGKVGKDTPPPAKAAKLPKCEPKAPKRSIAEVGGLPTASSPLPIVKLNADSQAALDRALAGIGGEVKAANERIAQAAEAHAQAAEAEHLAKMVAVTAEVEASGKALADAHAQMAQDGCPPVALRKPGDKPKAPPLAKGPALPRSAPGRELAIPTAKPQPPKTPQTRKEQEAMAKKMGLALDTKPAPKPGQRERSRFDWTGHEDAAKRGTMPPKLDFSADTHTRFRPTLAKIEAAAKAGDIKALKAIEINPVSSSPKAMIRWRDMCVTALAAKAKPAKAK
jgi:hypothetical protein